MDSYIFIYTEEKTLNNQRPKTMLLSKREKRVDKKRSSRKMAVLVLTQCARNFAYCSGQGRRGVCAVALLLILSVCLAVDVPIHFCAASGSIDVSSKMRDRGSCFCILCKTIDSNSKNWTSRVRMNLPIWSSGLRVRKVYF